MKNSTKLSLASSFTLVTILAAFSAPAYSSDINDLLPRSKLVSFCSDKALNSRHGVQMSLSDGTALRGIIKCESDFNDNYNNNDDHDDDDHNDRDDHDDRDDDDHDDDDHDDRDDDDHDDRDDRDDDDRDDH